MSGENKPNNNKLSQPAPKPAPKPSGGSGNPFGTATESRSGNPFGTRVETSTKK